MTTGHVKLSPSKRYQFSACPGSVREQAKYPDSRSGPAAIDGTHSHTLLERCIKTGRWPNAFVGQTIEDHDGSFVVDKARADRVTVAMDYIGIFTHTTVMSESRVDPEALVGRKDMGGTVDVQMYADNVLELIDYKDGINDAWVSALMQMEQYAVGVLAGFALTRTPYPFDKVVLTVIQPKLVMFGGEVIRSMSYSVQEILDIVPILIAEGAATEAPDAALVPGEGQCKYCRAKGSCSALASNVMKEIGVMFHPVVERSALDVAQQSANKDPSTMDNAQLAQIMEAAPLMRQLLEGVEGEVMRRVRAGQVVPGFKVVTGRGSRSWSVSDDDMATRLVKMGVPKSAVWETKLVSIAKAEKLTWEKTRAGEKVKMQLTERQIKLLETEYVTKLAGKLTIVPESDNRPEVVLTAAPLFGVVEEVPALPAWLL